MYSWKNTEIRSSWVDYKVIIFHIISPTQRCEAFIASRSAQGNPLVIPVEYKCEMKKRYLLDSEMKIIAELKACGFEIY